MAGWGKVLKRTLGDFGEDNGTRLAAALSYYTIFSLPPLLILLLLILGAVLEPDQVRAILEGQVGDLLGPAGSEQVAGLLAEADGPGTGLAAVLGVGALLLGALGAFAELQNALNRIFRVTPDPARGGLRRMVGQRFMGFGMLMTIAFLLIVSLVVSSMLSAFSGAIAGLLPGPLSGPALLVLNFVISLAVISLLFGLLLRVLPDAVIAWKDAFIGGLVTALLFVVGQFALGIYFSQAEPGGAFGAAGALALLLVWIYYSAVILFIGAEFTQAYASERGGGVAPAGGAVRVVERQEFVSPEEATARRIVQPRDRPGDDDH